VNLRKCAEAHGNKTTFPETRFNAPSGTLPTDTIPPHAVPRVPTCDRFVPFCPSWVYPLFIRFSATLARSTAAEVNFRVDTIYGLLTEGQSRGQIVQFGSKQWNITPRQVDEYIQRARIRLEEDAAMTRPSWIAEALGRARTYEQSAYKRGQTQVALNAIQLQAKLIGLEI